MRAWEDGMRNMRRMGQTTMVLATAMVCACASGGGGSRRPVTRAGERTVRVVIENQNWLDMSVYVQSSNGSRFRVGSVVTGRTEVFEIPTSRIGSGPFRLLGNPVGGNELTVTDPLVVIPGASAYWRIGNRPSTSFAVVR